ncbi:uncharacterized protein FPRO_03753 [Fusarium proliferatum ET1]|uniref:GATA-type domain-containing protein n=1 Tax=Fusarium proliferatum (strain ET1) TaxID=1227346 RepID=A0A1L7V572_FUSPR|nr:uncharacterized protein FPRO_03753 [Fusarium proliferatum ET1]CZR35987.1 uncharacterized protein FPRO_03753 [Fusarium proliferatum ET1]
MSNSPQILGQVNRGRSLQPSRANVPAGSPTVAIEQPKLSFPDRLLFGKYGSILKSNKATKVKVDNKTSVSSDGITMLEMVGSSDNNAGAVNWDDVITADRLAEKLAEEEETKEEAYIKKLMAEDAPLKPAIKRRNRDCQRDSRLKKFHKERQDRDIYSNDFFLPSSLPEGQGYSQPEAYGSLPPHRNTYILLDCRLRSTHYTISQDHTSGQEAHEDNLLASFGKRRRTDKPSIRLGGSRLLQRSPNFLPSLANGSDVVAQDEGSHMQEFSTADFDYLDLMAPLGSQMRKDAVSFPQETATTKPNEGKDRGDQIEFEWARKRERRRPVQSRPGNLGHGSQHSILVGTSWVSKSGDRSPVTLRRRCHSCNRIVSSEWRHGPDGAETLCNACGLHYAKLERRRN